MIKNGTNLHTNIHTGKKKPPELKWVLNSLSNLIFYLSLSPMQPDPNFLLDLVKIKMPYGKFKGVLLCDLPVSYLEWFNRKGFPKDKMGMLLQTIYEIKLNGLEYLLTPLKR